MGRDLRRPRGGGLEKKTVSNLGLLQYSYDLPYMSLHSDADEALQEAAAPYIVVSLDTCAFLTEFYQYGLKHTPTLSRQTKIHDFINQPFASLLLKHYSAPFQQCYLHTYERRGHSLLYIPNIRPLSVP